MTFQNKHFTNFPQRSVILFFPRDCAMLSQATLVAILGFSEPNCDWLRNLTSQKSFLARVSGRYFSAETSDSWKYVWVRKLRGRPPRKERKKELRLQRESNGEFEGWGLFVSAAAAARTALLFQHDLALTSLCLNEFASLPLHNRRLFARAVLGQYLRKWRHFLRL